MSNLSKLPEETFPQCRFTILGPPGLRCCGRQIDLGSPQQQAVLTQLLTNSGRLVPLAEFSAGIWGDRAPATSEATIRNYVSRLRRLLSGGGLGLTIRSRSGGYLLEPMSFSLDSTEFVQLIEDARNQCAGGNLTLAAKQLQEALDLWTGTALAGVPGDAAERERVRLERLKLIAAQELLRIKLELGQHTEVVAEVPLLIELNRLEERLYEIYLLALYRCGRRTEALENYRMIYNLLSNELGVPPGPRLREIHERILRADPAIDAMYEGASSNTHSSEQGGALRNGSATELLPTETIGGRLKRQRDRQFVGRERELAIFRSMLDGNNPERFAVLFVQGPIGIGKSTLLQRFADEASSAGRRVWRVDGRQDHPSRQCLEEIAEEVRDISRPVLLIDSFEEFDDLGRWFWHEFLPQLSSEAVVVMASRAEPDSTWHTDPSWAGGVIIQHLQELTVADSRALLKARGVPSDLQQSIMDFADGHPFALSLAAAVSRPAVRNGHFIQRDSVRYVVGSVLDRFIGTVPSATHRTALQVCALAYHTTEDLLKFVMRTDEAPALFDWLQKQPYVDWSSRGLIVRSPLRDTLEYDLCSRNPVGYVELNRRIWGYALDRLLLHSTDADSSVAAARTIGRLLRRSGTVGGFVSESGAEDLEQTALAAGDHETLIAMSGQTRGAFTAASVKFWSDRQPEAFRVFRDRDTGRIRAFMSWLILTRPDPVEMSADPVVADIWDDLSSAAPLTEGTHIAIARHLIYPVHEAKPSPITDMFQLSLVRDWLHDQKLASSYLVATDEQYWRPLLGYLDQRELKGYRRNHAHTIFGHDWRVDPPHQWRDRQITRQISRDIGPRLFARPDRIDPGRERKPA